MIDLGTISSSYPSRVFVLVSLLGSALLNLDLSRVADESYTIIPHFHRGDAINPRINLILGGGPEEIFAKLCPFTPDYLISDESNTFQL